MITKIKIDYINGPRTDKIFGMSKYQKEIVKRLDIIEWNVIEYNSMLEMVNSNYSKLFSSKIAEKSGGDLTGSADKNIQKSSVKTSSKNNLPHNIIEITKKYLNNIDRSRYKRKVKKNITEGNIKHITSQEFAYLLKSIKMKGTIVTCYDLIIWAYDMNRSALWKDNIEGMKLADKIITISEFSKNDIIKYLDYPEDNIKIVYPAVDHSFYYQNRDKEILNRWNISPEDKVVLYVGSETPRQNVPLLIEAFSKVKEVMPNVKLLKIGDSQSYGAREKNLKLISDLNLENDVIFSGYVSEKDIPQCYNATDLLVYPCSYAGFGLPPLEAMACGTPVITSDTSSLPEVVGDAGIMIDPHDVDLMAEKIYEVLNNGTLKERLVKKGIKRAKLFNWNKSAEETLQIYSDMM